MLASGGFLVEGRRVVSDERDDIESALRAAASEADMVLTTGGTGLGARDVTPEATKAVIEREAPGLAELMRASGLLSTPMAALSRAVVAAEVKGIPLFLASLMSSIAGFFKRLFRRN